MLLAEDIGTLTPCLYATEHRSFKAINICDGERSTWLDRESNPRSGRECLVVGVGESGVDCRVLTFRNADHAANDYSFPEADKNSRLLLTTQVQREMLQLNQESEGDTS